jgi:quercetin dioxygenase-like cupin family protein
MTNTRYDAIPWGGGEHIPGTPFRTVLSPEATDGHVVGIAVDMPPGLRVDEHVHPDEDQICIVLAGRVNVRVGGVESQLEAGTVQVLPRGVPHELWNPDETPARLIDLYTPPGMEQRFAAAGQSALAEGHDAASGDHYRATDPR